MNNLTLKLQGAWRSLTIRANVIMLVLWAALPELLPYLLEQAPVLKPYLGESAYQTMVLVVGAVNIVLRFRTSTPLEHK